jgi:hypothetical protein
MSREDLVRDGEIVALHDKFAAIEILYKRFTRRSENFTLGADLADG